MIFDRERLIQDMLEFFKSDGIEGSVSNFYLDSVGEITVGVGHMIKTKKEFMALKSYFHSTEDPSVNATDEMMESEWNRMDGLRKAWKTQKHHPLPHSYGDDAIVEMDDVGVDEDAKKKINEKINEMLSYYPTIFEAPYTAQMGLLDIVYNVGAAKRKKFLKFNQAIKDGDWLVASKESHRYQISEKRNQKVQAMFRAAALVITRNHTQMSPMFHSKDLEHYLLMDTAQPPYNRSTKPDACEMSKHFYLNPKDYLLNKNQCFIDEQKPFDLIQNNSI